MDRIRGGDAIPTIHAEIIPPQPGAAPISRPSRVVDVFPEFVSATRQVKTASQFRGRKAVTPLLWATIAVALIVTAFLVFRVPIVTWLPGTSGIYRAIGIPVAPSGATLEDVSVIRIYSRGSVLLTIEGNVANATGRQIDIPPMSLIVLGAEETALETIALLPAANRLDPNGSARFTTELDNPPAAMTGLAIQIGDGPLHLIQID